MHIVKTLSTLILCGVVAGCVSTQTPTNRDSLYVSSVVSGNVKLEPVAPEKRIAYVGVRDISGENFDVKKEVIAGLQAKGMQITEDPSKANFMLMATVLKVGKTTKDYAQSALFERLDKAEESFEKEGKEYQAQAVEFVEDTFDTLAILGNVVMPNIYYSVVVDVELRERLQQKNTTVMPEWLSSSKVVKNIPKQDENSNWMTHNTRVVTTANKADLRLKEALPEMRKDLSNMLMNILG